VLFVDVLCVLCVLYVLYVGRKCDCDCVHVCVLYALCVLCVDVLCVDVLYPSAPSPPHLSIASQSAGRAS
jgi:hypothetical protein